MEDPKLMPDHLDLREITFSNILLLGFNVENSESKYGTAFNRDMFATPNIKAMEVILHFIFTRLNQESAKEMFRGCWPIIEKKQAQQFRKVCVDWLNKIKKDPDCYIPNMSPAVLMSPSGNRFYQFLFYFSLYVLKQRMSSISKKFGSVPLRPIISPATKKFTHQCAAAQDLSVANKKERLIAFVEETVLVKNSWIDYASEISKVHRKLNKEKREWEKKVAEVKERMQLVLGKSSISTKDILKRTQDLQKVKDNWQTISKFYETQQKLMEQVKDIINEQHDPYLLDGGNINFKIPDILVRECERQLHLGNKYENIYEEGKVDLKSLVNLWNLSLHLAKECLTQFPLPNVSQDEGYIRVEAHKHGSNLNNTVSLKHKLQSQISDMNLSIDVLKETIKENPSVGEETPAKLPEKFSLDILPCTPSLVFEATNSELIEFDYSRRNLSPGNVVATPDAVQLMLDKLDSSVPKEDTPINPTISRLISEGSKPLKVAKDSKKPVASKIPTRKMKEKQKDIKLTSNQESDMASAQRILIEQITESVISNNPEKVPEKTVEILNLHAFENPMEAFNTDIFVHQDKLMRTPQDDKSDITDVFEHQESYMRTPQKDKPDLLEMFTPAQGYVAPLSQSFFTPICNFDFEEKSTKQIDKDIPLLSFIDEDWKCETPKDDVIDTKDKGYLRNDESTLKEENSVLTDITNNNTATPKNFNSPVNKDTIISPLNLTLEEVDDFIEEASRYATGIKDLAFTPLTQVEKTWLDDDFLPDVMTTPVGNFCTEVNRKWDDGL